MATAPATNILQLHSPAMAPAAAHVWWVGLGQSLLCNLSLHALFAPTMPPTLAAGPASLALLHFPPPSLPPTRTTSQRRHPLHPPLRRPTLRPKPQRRASVCAPVLAPGRRCCGSSADLGSEGGTAGCCGGRCREGHGRAGAGLRRGSRRTAAGAAADGSSHRCSAGRSCWGRDGPKRRLRCFIRWHRKSQVCGRSSRFRPAGTGGGSQQAGGGSEAGRAACRCSSVPCSRRSGQPGKRCSQSQPGGGCSTGGGGSLHCCSLRGSSCAGDQS